MRSDSRVGGVRKLSPRAVCLASTACASIGVVVGVGVSGSAQAGGPPPCGYEVEYYVAPECGIFETLSYGLGVNEAGAVVGYIDGCPDSNQFKAFVWWPDGTVEVISLPWSWAERAVDINNFNEVALGVNLAMPGLANVPALWANGEVVQIFEIPEWANNAFVAGINDSGVIVGEYGDTVLGPHPLAATWSVQEGLVDLSEPFPVERQRPVGINNDGIIAGFWFGDTVPPPGEDLRRAFSLADGKVTNLGIVPGSVNSNARGLSDAGHVIGEGFAGPLPFDKPRTGFVWQDGKFTLLPPLPLDGHDQAQPRSINSSGLIVGRSIASGGGAPNRPALWFDGERVDLNSVVANLGAGENVHNPVAISESGIITGTGTHQSSARAFRLRPRPTLTADFDNDCEVSSSDLGILLRAWGPVVPRLVGNAADINQDGMVDGADLGVLLSEWTG